MPIQFVRRIQRRRVLRILLRSLLDRRSLLCMVGEVPAALEELRAQAGDEFAVCRSRLPCALIEKTLNRFSGIGAGNIMEYPQTLTSSSIPLVVRRLSGNDDPQLVWTNERGGATFRSGNRFVKWNPHATGLDLEAERLRLEWAIRWHLVPRVLDWGADDEAQWMVTAALPGEGAVTQSWIAHPLEAARAIGRGLRMLHDMLPVANCPFDWSVESRIGYRIPVEKLGMPPIDRLVVCHGDACSPNTIFAPDGSPACHVDLGSLGVTDRWADLAVASMNLDYNFGPSWEDEFFTAYGIERDEERISFYRFLWENEDEIGVSIADMSN